ncbi:hypothetical protein Taro_009460, partial [Colocasia esculenta]|nr:hypothetical protein [Colocasia esculenta]
SFPVLFDNTKVEKKNIFTGTFMPSTGFTGGYRVLSYLDPSEPNHTRLKQLLFNIFAGRKAHFIPEFRRVYSQLFDDLESQLTGAGKSDFNALNDHAAFEYIFRAYFGASTAGSPLGSTGPDKATKWVLFQLAPILSLGKPWPLEELLLHTFPLPPCLLKKDYKVMFDFISSVAGDAIKEAEKLGVPRDEAVHNLLFAVCFNTYVAFKSGTAAVAEEGGQVTLAAVEKMELTASVVLETFRMDPPVRYQYGKAKRDLTIESHDAAFRVRKGEVIFGYQTFATRDERVFKDGGRFVADRFVGEKGRELMKYVVWANGPHTEQASVSNKMCAGKNVGFLFARLLLVEMFLRYDTFKADVSVEPIGSRIIFKSITKAPAAAATTTAN